MTAQVFCYPDTVYGVYKADSTLGEYNYVDVQVNVSAIGNYNITTDTVNGYWFSGSGRLGYGGVNRIRLYGHGKPVVGGINTFIVLFDSSSNCEISVTVQNGPLTTSIYTFGSSSGTCTGATLSGTYTAGTSLGDTNTVTIQVNVTDTGTYSISTQQINGVIFFAQGTFDSLGTHNVALTGSGKPLVASSYNYNLGTEPNACYFTINYLHNSGGPGNAVFSVGTSNGSCAGFASNVPPTVGVALTAQNTAQIQVNVTTIGAYSISTNTVDGIIYSGSGIFTSTGAQDVTLTGAGTPITANAPSFKVTGPAGDTCSFFIQVAAANNGAAVYTLAGSPANCSFATPSGTYTVGTILTAANTVSIQVNVTTPGSYSISTSPSNGISFTGAGIFTTTGTTTAVLTGTGTPTTPGTANFQVLGGTTGCLFPLQINPQNGGMAAYTLDCNAAAQTGNYIAGTAVSGASEIFQVNVTTTGTYSINIPTNNGIFFSDIGTFTTTGQNSVTLQANGIPIKAGTFGYTITGPSNSCNFNIPVDTPATTGLFSCDINGTLTEFDLKPLANSINSNTQIDIIGNNAYTSQNIDLEIKQVGNIVPGVFSSTDPLTSVALSYTDASGDGSWAAGLNTTAPLTITITSITNTTITGTFSGTMADNYGLGTTVPITNGTFSVPIQYF